MRSHYKAVLVGIFDDCNQISSTYSSHNLLGILREAIRKFIFPLSQKTGTMFFWSFRNEKLNHSATYYIIKKYISTIITDKIVR